MNDAAKQVSENEKELRLALEKSEQEQQEYLAGWQRARADFLNYKKEQEKVMDEFRSFANADLLEKILAVLDNFNRACESLPDNLKEDAWAKGVLSVRRQFAALLSEQGVEEVKVAKGDRFNPEFHEAVEEIEGEGEGGTISEVLQKGYTLHGKVIRPVRIKVIR